MKKPSLLKTTDFSKELTMQILNSALEFKKKHDSGLRFENLLQGKSVAMIFEKASLRTKVAFEIATASLGGIPVYLTSQQILASGNNQKGRESIPDIARNLERFCDLIMARVYKHESLVILDQNLKIPLINLLCDQHHPTQALADALAILWHKKTFKGIKVAFIGDGNNVATSLMQMCALLGMDFSIASPKGYAIPQIYQDQAPNHFQFLEDPCEAVKDADVIYTDTFISMGQEAETAQRLKDFTNYQVNMNLLKQAKKDAIFMHCLPAHRGEEVTDEVMDCSQSIVFDQAECRMHIAKALIKYYLG